jgi:hypothetical protein
MGIKNYLKELKQDDIIKHKEYDMLYIDCNYVIHYLIYNCTSDIDLQVKIANFIKYLFESVTIKKQIHLIFDGNYDKQYDTNPKLETQTKRMQSVNSSDYDKQQIAPKSRIIQFFKDNLIRVLNTYISPFKQQFVIIVNDDYVDGEADIKILNLIANNKNKICILSKDTDMILISYNTHLQNKDTLLQNKNKLLQNKNTLLQNKDKLNGIEGVGGVGGVGGIGGDSSGGVGDIDILCNLRPLKIININKLVKKHDIFGRDYLLLLLLMGNDFLPCIGQVNYKKLIETYKHTFIQVPLVPDGNRIIINNKVNYDNLVLFISCYIINAKCKFNYDNITMERFNDYYNNLIWCLHYYNIIGYTNNHDNHDNGNNDTKGTFGDIHSKGCKYIQLTSLNKVINAYNFIYSGII